MLAAFVGDTHGKILAVYDYLAKWTARTGHKVDAVVQVGDFGIFLSEEVRSDFLVLWHGEAQIPIPTAVCPGNHESIVAIREWSMQPGRIPNLRMIGDGCTMDIGQSHDKPVHVGAIWGNYSPKAWAHPDRVVQARKYATRSPKSMHINRFAVERLRHASQRIDVLVTHDAASCAFPPGFGAEPVAESVKAQWGLEPGENPKGCPGFIQILDHHRPKHYFFGHFHSSWQTHLGGTNITCLAAFDQQPDRAVEFVNF